MPRRKDSSEWKTDSRGRYRRMVGWKEEEGGKRVQQPFYLGVDLDQAKARYLRLKELWSHLEKVHEESLQQLNSRFELPERTECRWKAESLWIARELAAGRVQISAPPPERLHASAYVSRINGLGKSYPMVYFVPEAPEVYREGEDFWRIAVEHQQKKFPLPLTNVVLRASQSLHEALDAYVEHVRKAALEPTPDGPMLTSFGHLKVEQARRIKARQADRPLSTLDLQGCQELLDYWRMRPLTEKTPKRPSRPMEARYCENHVAELNRFFKWLHKAKAFDWRKPEDFDDLETKVKDLPEERTGIGFLNVEVFRIEELAILNKYATPLERLLILLGLNCGFKGAEQGTLRFDHPAPPPRWNDPAANRVRPPGRRPLRPVLPEQVQGLRRVPALAPDDRRPPMGGGPSEADLRPEGDRVVAAPHHGPGPPVLPPHREREERDPDLHQQVGGADEAGPQGPPRLPPVQLHEPAGHGGRPDSPHRRGRSRRRLPDARQAREEGRPAGPLHEPPVRRGLPGAPPARPRSPARLRRRPERPWEVHMQQYTSLGVREQILELHRQGVKAPEIARRLGKSPMTVYRLVERRASNSKAD